MISYTDAAEFAITLLINLIILGLPLAIGVATAFRLTRLSSPRWRHVIAVAAFFIVSLLPVAITIDAYHLEVPELTTVEHNPRSPSNSSANASDVNTEAIQLPLVAELPDAKTNELVSAVNSLVKYVTKSPLAKALFWIWIVMAALLLIREVVGHTRLALARRTWQPAKKIY